MNFLKKSLARLEGIIGGSKKKSSPRKKIESIEGLILDYILANEGRSIDEIVEFLRFKKPHTKATNFRKMIKVNLFKLLREKKITRLYNEGKPHFYGKDLVMREKNLLDEAQYLERDFSRRMESAVASLLSAKKILAQLEGLGGIALPFLLEIRSAWPSLIPLLQESHVDLDFHPLPISEESRNVH